MSTTLFSLDYMLRWLYISHEYILSGAIKGSYSSSLLNIEQMIKNCDSYSVVVPVYRDQKGKK